jgi:hypothetical protein
MSKANLILRCGAERVEREQVNAVLAPEATATYTPLPHSGLIDLVTQNIRTAGYEITGEAHALTKEGARYFGLFEIEPTREELTGLVNADYSLVLGLRNSHDKSLPAGLVLGSQVLVCDNLSFSGEIKLARKHTPNLVRDLTELIVGACGRVAEKYKQNDRRFDAYKHVELDDRDTHDTVIRALDAGAICGSHVTKVLAEYRTPRHPEFAGKTVWGLYNAFTEVAKDSNLFTLPTRTQALHAVLDGLCGITPGLALAN